MKSRHDKIKVLRILARMTGGPCKHVSWLGEGLKERCNTLFLCGKLLPSEDMSWFYNNKGLPLQQLRFLKREVNLFRDILNIFEIIFWIFKFRPHIIHTHTSKAGFNGRIAAFLVNSLFFFLRAPRIKVVHTFHGHTFHSYFSPVITKFFIILEQWLARFATDKILVLSQQLYNEIHLDFKIGAPEQYVLVPLGIGMEFAQHLDSKYHRSNLQIPQGDFVFGCIGRITPIKNYESLIYACTHIQDKELFHCAIIGDGEPQYLRQLHNLCQTSQVERIHFLGMQSDMKKTYGLINALVLCSHNEGTPVVILEAFAAGIPVISRLVGGVKDLLGPVVEEHEAFSLFERGIGIKTPDPVDLSTAMLWFLRNRSHSELGFQCRSSEHYVFENHSLSNLCNNVFQVYQELVVVPTAPHSLSH
jgi:glycosyltransferase involved in cell wall biosynthesis